VGNFQCRRVGSFACLLTRRRAMALAVMSSAGCWRAPTTKPLGPVALFRVSARRTTELNIALGRNARGSPTAAGSVGKPNTGGQTRRVRRRFRCNFARMEENEGSPSHPTDAPASKARHLELSWQDWNPRGGACKNQQALPGQAPATGLQQPRGGTACSAGPALRPSTPAMSRGGCGLLN